MSLVIGSDEDDCFEYLELIKLIVKYHSVIVFSAQYPKRYCDSRCGRIEAENCFYAPLFLQGMPNSRSLC